MCRQEVSPPEAWPLPLGLWSVLPHRYVFIRLGALGHVQVTLGGLTMGLRVETGHPDVTEVEAFGQGLSGSLQRGWSLRSTTWVSNQSINQPTMRHMMQP